MQRRDFFKAAAAVVLGVTTGIGLARRAPAKFASFPNGGTIRIIPGESGFVWVPYMYYVSPGGWINGVWHKNVQEALGSLDMVSERYAGKIVNPDYYGTMVIGGGEEETELEEDPKEAKAVEGRRQDQV